MVGSNGDGPSAHRGVIANVVEMLDFRRAHGACSYAGPFSAKQKELDFIMEALLTLSDHPKMQKANVCSSTSS